VIKAQKTKVFTEIFYDRESRKSETAHLKVTKIAIYKWQVSKNKNLLKITTQDTNNALVTIMSIIWMRKLAKNRINKTC
jgi:hypothetical protein